MIGIITTLIIIYISKNNIISIFIGIEIILLMITLKIIYISEYQDDINATIFAIIIIILAGAESAIGLSILITYYKLRGNLTNII